MIEMKKTDVYAQWLDDLRDIERVLASKPGLSVWPLAIG